MTTELKNKLHIFKIDTTKSMSLQTRNALIKNLRYGKTNIIKLEPKLPRNWSNFRIVQTQSGTFTGQITYKKLSKKSIKEWDKKGRVKLAIITKKYLESLLGYKIIAWKGKKS